MRHFLFSLLCLVLIAPASAVAQNNVKKAFDKLIDSKNAELTETHKSERDPSSGDLEAMSDVIDFTIPLKNIDLINNIEEAFKQDAPKSYGFYSGLNGRKGGDNMSVSTGGNSSVDIIAHNGSKYTYALFLDPKHSDKYRYAYCLSYIKDAKEIRGRLVISYSTTLKYRQEHSSRVTTSHKTSSKKWIDEFLSQIATLESVERSQSNATYVLRKIYGLCSNLPADLSKQDKQLALNILSSYTQNKKYNDTNMALLNASIECLK